MSTGERAFLPKKKERMKDVGWIIYKDDGTIDHPNVGDLPPPFDGGITKVQSMDEGSDEDIVLDEESKPLRRKRR